jgi:hypothetical protein
MTRGVPGGASGRPNSSDSDSFCLACSDAVAADDATGPLVCAVTGDACEPMMNTAMMSDVRGWA